MGFPTSDSEKCFVFLFSFCSNCLKNVQSFNARTCRGIPFKIFVFRCVLVSLLGFSESLVKTYYWLASVLSASSQLLQKCEVFNTPSYIL